MLDFRPELYGICVSQNPGQRDRPGIERDSCPGICYPARFQYRDCPADFCPDCPVASRGFAGSGSRHCTGTTAHRCFQNAKTPKFLSFSPARGDLIGPQRNIRYKKSFKMFGWFFYDCNLAFKGRSLRFHPLKGEFSNTEINVTSQIPKPFEFSKFLERRCKKITCYVNSQVIS